MSYLLEQLRREQAAVAAMHRRPWWRVGVLLRRPWRAPKGPRNSGWRGLVDWLYASHDCQDPMVGCSCSGGFRFPHIDTKVAPWEA